MAYKMIAASKDENGKIVGGAAGDQTGKEVWEYLFNDSRAYYYWEPLTQEIADAIYRVAKALADNNNIGYDQGQRLTAWSEYQKVGSVSKITNKCECDCSSALRIILHEALGIDIGNLITSSIPDKMETLTKYFKKKQVYSASKRIPTGSVLCTQKKGHTGILSNGYSVVSNSSSNTKSIDEVAKDVINGKYGSGDTRKKKLAEAGYDHKTVQNRVNEILNGSAVKVDKPTSVVDETKDNVKVVSAKNSANNKDTSLAGQYTVTADALYVRNGAGTNHTALVKIPKGTKVRCYGFYTKVGSTKWLLIQFIYNGVQYTGFSSSTYLKK